MSRHQWGRKVQVVAGLSWSLPVPLFKQASGLNCKMQMGFCAFHVPILLSLAFMMSRNADSRGTEGGEKRGGGGGGVMYTRCLRF